MKTSLFKIFRPRQFTGYRLVAFCLGPHQGRNAIFVLERVDGMPFQTRRPSNDKIKERLSEKSVKGYRVETALVLCYFSQRSAKQVSLIPLAVSQIRRGSIMRFVTVFVWGC